jgi:hypothetical protein
VKIHARLFVRLYPRAWRARYGDELTALLDELPAAGARVAFDLAVGALREQLRAVFVDVPERRRQNIFGFFVAIGSWAVGTIGTALVALALPDSEKGSALRSIFFMAGIFGSIGTLVYVVALQKNREAGLAPGVPALTPKLAYLIVFLVVASAVAANLQAAHAYHLGKKTLAEVWMSSAARGMVFGPTGLGIAALIWPDKFRNLDPQPPGPSSTLGLGA